MQAENKTTSPTSVDPIVIRRALCQSMRKIAQSIRDRHREVMESRKGLPWHQIPMDASYWADELREASRLEKAADESEAV